MFSATLTSAILAGLLAVVCGPGLTSAQQSTCPEGFEFFDSTCFSFVTQPMSWADASENCEAQGATLAVLSDCHLFGDVVKHINAQGLQDSDFWIGATDEAEEDNWLWINGESVEMGTPFWGQTSGEPEPGNGVLGNCAVLYADDRHYFHDNICGTSFGSLCEAVPIPATGL